MSEKDGGSAFPKYFGMNSDLAQYEYAGMSLRDYFAGQALGSGLPGYAGFNEIAAKRCYELADAMIAERTRGEKS